MNPCRNFPRKKIYREWDSSEASEKGSRYMPCRTQEDAIKNDVAKIKSKDAYKVDWDVVGREVQTGFDERM